ncbi:MAG: glycosyltransferase [Erysipelotrichaceae bacterium]|nr:glycosyltransferase [Erysipelotrichaceae bacterium]
MKICFLIDDFSATGGIQRVVPLIASNLDAFYDVHVVSMYNEHNSENLSFYKTKRGVHILIKGKKEYVKQCLKASKLLRDYIINNSIDILISTSEMLTPYCLLTKSFLDLEFMCWTHSTAYRYNESILQRPFKFLMMHSADKVIALTQTIKKELDIKYKTNNVTVISNPIDPKLFNDKAYKSDSKKIITVGRFCFEKYYEKLVEVANIVLKNNTEWTWDIFGNGASFDEIKQLVEESGLSNQLKLMGSVNDLYDRYNEYSILVMTSRSEAYPMALLEGIASKLPLIAFGIPSIKELIRDNYNGYIVEPFDAEEMASKIQNLISDESKRIEFSNNNSLMSDSYKIDEIIKQWKNIIENN